MNHRTTLRTTALAGAVALCLTASGCAGTDSASGTKTLTFWGWAPGYADAVKEFNRTHTDIKIEYQAVQPGANGGYEKMLNATKAGNAPCLAQVGYETIPSFATQGALQDVSEYAEADKGDYLDSAWKSVSLVGNVYGSPVDTGPMALFYNKKTFDSLGLDAPTTWAEYRTAAKRIHAADPDSYISSPYRDYDYAGLARQVGASWFGTENDSWQTHMDSAANKKVADYWQSLADDGLISDAPMYDQAWYSGLSDGRIATVVGAVYQAATIKGGAKKASGDWAVAPMPQWTEGADQVGSAGGSATAVLNGCEDAEEAWDFAHWLSTDRKAFGGLVEKASLYPAAEDLLDLPQLGPDPYFGDQDIYQVFAEASESVDPDWTWGPLMTKTSTDLNDGLGKAWSGHGTIAAALRSAQDKTREEMKKQGLSVSD